MPVCPTNLRRLRQWQNNRATAEQRGTFVLVLQWDMDGANRDVEDSGVLRHAIPSAVWQLTSRFVLIHKSSAYLIVTVENALSTHSILDCFSNATIKNDRLFTVHWHTSTNVQEYFLELLLSEAPGALGQMTILPLRSNRMKEQIFTALHSTRSSHKLKPLRLFSHAPVKPAPETSAIAVGFNTTLWSPSDVVRSGTRYRLRAVLPAESLTIYKSVTVNRVEHGSSTDW